QLPLIDIQSIEQAQTILKQIATLPISPNWHRQVDKATLHSLFQAI
ncbi:MAG: hypothetical protein ACI85N_002018, partial [Gammaproteobacteria bacterium]